VAVNCTRLFCSPYGFDIFASPRYTVGWAGVTVTEVIPTTISAPSPPVVALTTVPRLADIAIGPPPPIPEAKPAPGPVVLIVATLPLPVPHVTVDVKS